MSDDKNTVDKPAHVDPTQLGDGTPVYDVNGQPVGTLNLRKTGDYLVVDEPGGRELYLPLSAVNESGSSGITLSLGAARARERRVERAADAVAAMGGAGGQGKRAAWLATDHLPRSLYR